MVELRKRPAPPSAPPPAKKKAPSKAKASTSKKNDASKAEEPPASNPAEDEAGGIPEGAGGVSATAAINSAEDAKATAAGVEADAVKGKKPAGGKPSAPKQGETVELEGFGGEVETQEGKKVTLAELVKQSKAGVVLFTYPKASTPGCTKQACLFRDGYEPLTATGLSIYGLSTDSPKSNTNFKTKQSLPYDLLCDPSATLIHAIGLKKAPKSTQRGVFVVDKEGKLLAAEAGGPAETVDVVKRIVEGKGGNVTDAVGGAEHNNGEDVKMADTAAEVADSAAKVDA